MQSRKITIRHDSELKTEKDALAVAKEWSELFGTYETVEKVDPYELFDECEDHSFYVTNRFDPRCSNKTPGYHPEL